MAVTEKQMRFLRACRRQPVDCTPVWFMRQAGRYLPEYRRIRERYGLLDICRAPDLAAEVTLQPVRTLGVDAAILFADILLPLIPMGVELHFAAGEGPVIGHPVRSATDVAALRPLEPEADLPFVLETIRLVRRELDGRVPLIGFAGAPFTLASYLIEGGASRDYVPTRRFMWCAPDAWHMLMDRLAEAVTAYLRAQVRAGAQALQLFDSWVGCLSPNDYREYVFPYSRRVLSALAEEGVPVIHFGTGTAGLLEWMRDAGGDVIGVDWRIGLGTAWQRLGTQVAIQGNLDPAALLGPREALEQRVRQVLEEAAGRPGHIFNLGHGILPQTPVEHVKAVVEMVHAFSQR